MSTAPEADRLDGRWHDIKELLAETPTPPAGPTEAAPQSHDLIDEAETTAQQIITTAEHQADVILADARQELARLEAKTAKRQQRSAWIDRALPKVALAGAVTLTALGEFQLAHLTGFPGAVAAMLPTTLDAYVIAAIRKRRDIILALSMAIAANALYHLAAQHLFGVDRQGNAAWWLIVGVASIAPVVVWRIHQISHPMPETETETKAVETPVSGPQLVSICSGPVGLSLPETAETRDLEPQSPAVPETETAPTETAGETAGTRSRETGLPKRRETETAQATPRSRPRKTTETNTVAIGDRGGDQESEIRALVSLMETEGDPMAISLKDAIETTGRPKATAAKRLAAARDRYRKTA